MSTVQLMRVMREKLAFLSPEKIEIFDQSSKHLNHPGAKSGGHYSLIIVSPEFEGKSIVTRHRIIYDALGKMMYEDIHALSIKAYTPKEIIT